MKFFNKFLELIFPSNLKCIFCGEELDGLTSNCTCKACYEKLPFINNCCLRCGLGVSNDNEGVCLNCKMLNYNFDKARAVFEYRGNVLKTIHKFKFGGIKDFAKPLAGFMCDVFSTANLDADVICSVPIHTKRMKERKFNQSELLAKAIADKFKIPYIELCVKVKENVSQTTLGFKDRKENVKDVYEIVEENRREIKGRSILIIDDIFTTGATVDEIAGLLKIAGAKSVNVLTILIRH